MEPPVRPLEPEPKERLVQQVQVVVQEQKDPQEPEVVEDQRLPLVVEVEKVVSVARAVLVNQEVPVVKVVQVAQVNQVVPVV